MLSVVRDQRPQQSMWRIAETPGTRHRPCCVSCVAGTRGALSMPQQTFSAPLLSGFALEVSTSTLDTPPCAHARHATTTPRNQSPSEPLHLLLGRHRSQSPRHSNKPGFDIPDQTVGSLSQPALETSQADPAGRCKRTLPVHSSPQLE